MDKSCQDCKYILDPSKTPCNRCHHFEMWELKPREREVRILMDDQGRLFAEDRYGCRYIITYDEDGVVAH